MPRPKGSKNGVKTKRVSVKDRMREALEEARAEADIKPIKRASKGATVLKSSPFDKFRYRKIRLHNGTVECDTDEKFAEIAKKFKQEKGVDILSMDTLKDKGETNGEDQTGT